MRDTEAAFKWIVSILRRHDVPFKIEGGLAARIYGSKRELNDIDISIPDEFFSIILDDVKEFVVFGPAQYKDEDWDLRLLTLRYMGQDIDLSGASKIFDKSKMAWHAESNDFNSVDMAMIFSIRAPVIRKEDLIGYKKRLARDVDIEDVRQMSG